MNIDLQVKGRVTQKVIYFFFMTTDRWRPEFLTGKLKVKDRTL
jgi:hypothetical protein